MRVWVVDDTTEEAHNRLAGWLRQLENQASSGVCLLGACSYQSDLTGAIRKLVPDLLDVLVVRDEAWPADASLQEVLDLGVGAVVVTAPQGADRFQELASAYPIVFAPTNCGAEGLWLALLGAAAGQRRQAHWMEQVAALQQRLKDRIIIERAKGILIEQLAVSEEDAYRRLRVLARRQQRPIREIAQSLLDMHALLKADAQITRNEGEDGGNSEAMLPPPKHRYPRRGQENGALPAESRPERVGT